jgi:hypothetical protein
MAGHRRGTGKPLRSVGKAERRLSTFNDRLAHAQTPAQRVSVTADYLRAALAAAPISVAEQVAATVVDYLTTHATQLDNRAPVLTVATSERKAS